MMDSNAASGELLKEGNLLERGRKGKPSNKSGTCGNY